MQARWSWMLVAGLMLPAWSQSTVRVSTGPTNFQGNFNSLWGSVSADGRYVAFHSMASNLILNDLNGHLPDIFVKDVQTFAVVLASSDSSGVPANNGSIAPALSADGRWVAFESDATNLVAGDGNLVRDIFVKDLQTGATVRASVDSNGLQADGPSYQASISGDGRWVAFESDATNLVPGDTNGVRDVFVHDVQSGATLRVSVSSAGVEGLGASTIGVVAGDGSCVAFQSDASNLVPGDTNLVSDVFLWERASGITTRVSVGAGAVEGDLGSFEPALSADGRYVAFESDASNLVAGDTNAVGDIFLRDRVNGSTQRVSVGAFGVQGNGASSITGGAQLSADGRFVAFDSWASNLVAGDTNGGTDCFVHDQWTGATVRVSVTTTGAQAGAGSRSPAMSSDGRYFAFESSASNLVPGDNNNYWDVFRRDVGVPSPSQAFCFGDGVDTSHVSACPCSNFGSGGHGCASSVNPSGASLFASGNAAADDVVLRGSGMPATSVCIYLQGDALDDAVFGDGVRCTGGALLRLRARSNAGGASSFPDSTDTVTLSARGGVTVGSGTTLYYQTYYRNAAAAFCPPETFNVTNGWWVTW